MNKFKNLALKIYYGQPWDNMIVFITLLLCAALTFAPINSTIPFIIWIFLSAYYLINRKINYVKSNNLFYFNLNYMLFSKKRVWINQKVKKGRNMNICPREVFIEELNKIAESLPEGTICYCYTQSYITKHIKDTFKNVETKKLSRKKAHSLVMELENSACSTCTNECMLHSLKNDKTKKHSFYGIKFVASNK